MKKRYSLIALGVFLMITGILWYKTCLDIRMTPASLSGISGGANKPQLSDRYGTPVTVTYQNRWNTSLHLPVHIIPETVKKIFIFSEDKRFYSHHGVDWIARFHALFQAIKAGKTVRGASTISEQVVRMIHERPRTVWSRWLEGIEASRLEKRFSKQEIFEFYLNQVPYASNRRGIGQAALFYFNRSVDTLSLKEMLALAVLVRAPSLYDLHRHPGTIAKPLKRLAHSLASANYITRASVTQLESSPFELEQSELSVNAPHFASYVLKALPGQAIQTGLKMKTTLDGVLQNKTVEYLQKALKKLGKHNVRNAACLVSDHRSGDILVWASVSGVNQERVGQHINSVLSPRQPGSSLKPFLYCLALEKGWSAATLIDDTSLSNPVGRGLHTYHNYSRQHHGRVTLRQALGNSLNIPAVKTIRFTGIDHYLSMLRRMGIVSLKNQPDFYGDGLALGNGEITLFELVQAYNVIANKGIFSPLRFSETGMINEMASASKEVIFSKEVTSLIANILSDPEARLLEFGGNSVLDLPVQTAVKTGTSNDYHDAWAMGFNYRYTVGVWMGNLDRRPTDGITGSKGPALVLRSLFSDLNKREETRPLYMSPALVRRDICLETLSGEKCRIVSELFINKPESLSQVKKVMKKKPIGFVKPVNGLEMAMDPRIPDASEAFEFVLSGVSTVDRISWVINGEQTATTRGSRYLWPLQKGRHIVEATVLKSETKQAVHNKVIFTVK